MKKENVNFAMKDHRGVTMVEIMVIVAIMLIAAGSVMNLKGYLSGKQARQCAYKLEAAISEIRVETMSKSNGELGSVYLAIENREGDIYARQVIKGNERKDLLGEQVTVLVTDTNGLSTTLENGTTVCVYFDRATGGLSDKAVQYTQLEISQGITTYVVEIEPDTGNVGCTKK